MKPNSCSFLFKNFSRAPTETETPQQRALWEQLKQQWLATHTPTKLPAAFAWFVQPQDARKEPNEGHPRFRGHATLKPMVMK